MKCDMEKENLNVVIQEDLDMNNCKTLKAIVDGYIIKYKPQTCVFDLGAVDFIDSSGIGFLIGRKKLLELYEAKMIIKNSSENIKKQLNFSKEVSNLKFI